MPGWGVRRNSYTFGTAVKACGRDWGRAEQLLGKMRGELGGCDVEACNAVTNEDALALAQLTKATVGKAADRPWVCKKTRLPGVHGCDGASGTLGHKTGWSVRLANATLDALKRLKGFIDEGVPFKGDIGSVHCGAHIVHLGVLDENGRSGARGQNPDADADKFSVSAAPLAAINCCAEGGAAEAARRLFDAMPGWGVRRDAKTFGAAVKACRRDWERAEQLLGQMRGELG
eukprot:gene57908-biopygen105040